MKVNSRNKGNKNERNLAKVLSDWTNMEFAKVPASGGLHWKNPMLVTGDVIPTLPQDIVDFPFSVETKFYKEVQFQDLILPNNSDILKWWSQATRDALAAKKAAIVFFRYNRLPRDFYFVIISYANYIRIKKFIIFTNGFLNYKNKIVIMSSTDFLETDYDRIEPYIKPEKNEQ